VIRHGYLQRRNSAARLFAPAILAWIFYLFKFELPLIYARNRFAGKFGKCHRRLADCRIVFGGNSKGKIIHGRHNEVSLNFQA
jgi:hypothetical protein